MEDNDHYDIKELLAMTEETRLHFVITPKGSGRRKWDERHKERKKDYGENL